MTEPEELIRRAYEAFNTRDIDAALALMDPDVDWPNAIEGGRVRGHDDVRPYWEGQFATIDPHVEPRRFTTEGDGRIAVVVEQTVRDLDGNLIAEETVEHVYTLRDGLVTHMEIRSGGATPET
jgi:ketosteroid isomerase-like protein